MVDLKKNVETFWTRKIGMILREANNMHLTMHGIKCGKKWGSTGMNENLVMKYPQSGSIKLGKPRQKDR